MNEDQEVISSNDIEKSIDLFTINRKPELLPELKHEDSVKKETNTSLLFAIQYFKLQCSNVEKSADNSFLKYKYATLADINKCIRTASEKTLKNFDDQIIVFVQTDKIDTIHAKDAEKGRVGIQFTASIVATCRNTGNKEKESLTILYDACIPISEAKKGTDGAQAYATIITYIEKKVKSCLLHLSEEDGTDPDISFGKDKDKDESKAKSQPAIRGYNG